MLKFLITFIGFLVGTCSINGQTNDINAVRLKYIDWLTDYSVGAYTPTMNSVFNRYMNACTNAETAINTSINFAQPGAPWVMTNDSDDGAFTNLVRNQLFYLVMAYQLKGPIVNGQPSNTRYHDPQLKNLIINVFNYMKDKGINSSTNFGFITNTSQELLFTYTSQFGLRAHLYGISVFLMKEDLVAAGEFSHHMGVLSNVTSFLSPSNPNFNFTYPGFNADVIRGLVETRLCYVLGQDDSESDHLGNMVFLKNFINHSLKISNGWADTIKPDFMAFHHIAAYPNSYGADALNTASVMDYILQGSQYELNTESKYNLKRALLSYAEFSADSEIPRALTGRFPNSTRMNIDPFAILYITNPADNLDAGKLYRRMYVNTVPTASAGTMKRLQFAGQINSTLMPDNPISEGHFIFPYGGINVHKYNGYQVSVKGTSKNIWSYENSSSENIFGRYNSAGTMEIFSAGIPKTRLSNGLGVAGTNGAVTDNGWDWSHLPGVTAAYLPYSILGTGIHRLFSGKNYLIHAKLDQNGVFAMDYKDAHSSTGMVALKTVFFYKDKLLCLGSGISDPGGTYPVHTTIFQTGLQDAATPTYINGNIQTGINTAFVQSSGVHWMTDGVGNGFVIPVQGLQGSLNIKRGTQQSRNQSNTADTQGNYSTAYIDHGTSPVNNSYRYGIILQGGQSGTEAFANNFAGTFDVIQHDNSAHVVRFVGDQIYNYAVFNPAVSFQSDALISVDTPSVIMTEKTDNGSKIKISATTPLTLLQPNESFTYNQIANNAVNTYRLPQTITVKTIIAGHWQLENPIPAVSTAVVGNNTEITFSTKNGLSIQAVLIPNITLSTLKNIKQENRLIIYPNPSDNYLFIDKPMKNKGKLKVYDVAGRDVTSIVQTEDQSERIKLLTEKLSNGIYQICINDTCEKIIKK